MPIQCEYFAMEGLTQMIEVIREVMSRPPNRLQFGGILLTMYDHALELTHEVDHEVRRFLWRDRVSHRDPSGCGRRRSPQPWAVRSGLLPTVARGLGIRRTVHGGTRA